VAQNGGRQVPQAAKSLRTMCSLSRAKPVVCTAAPGNAVSMKTEILGSLTTLLQIAPATLPLLYDSDAVGLLRATDHGVLTSEQGAGGQLRVTCVHHGSSEACEGHAARR
jgi:hypothetical protein